MVGLPAAVQAAAASIMVVVALGGVVYRFAIQPIKRQAHRAEQTAGEAMSRADTAVSRADEAEATAEDVADSVDDQLGDIRRSLNSIEESLSEQAREARGRTYTIYRLVETIRESDSIDAENVPHVDEDDFLRGGRDFSPEEGDD